MRISKVGPVFLLAVVWLSVPSASAESIAYIPVVWAQAGEPVDSTRLICWDSLRFWGAIWKTEIQTFNNGLQDGLMTPLEVYGYGGQWRPPDPVQVTAGGVNDVFPYPPFGVGVLKARLGNGLTVSSSLRRADQWFPVAPGGGGEVTQGSTPLQIASAPFQAGQETVTDAVLLGNPGLLACIPQNQKYIPRVNVTLVNTSSSPASFRVIVKVRRLGTDHRSEAPTVFDNSYAVEPLDVYQANAISIPFPDVPADGVVLPGGDYFGWIFITADQPFLSWASTVINDPEPKALSFSVYPSKAIN